MESVQFFKVRSIGEIINDTFVYIRYHFKGLLKSILVICGPFLILTSIISSLFQFIQGENTENYMVIFAFVILLIILSVFAYNLLLIVPLEYIRLSYKKNPKDITISEVWQETKKDFWMIVFTYIGMSILAFLGSILFIIPGIYLGIALSIMPIIRIWERLDFNKSFTRSRTLIKNYWWFTFGLMFMIGLIAFSLVFVFYLPNYALGFIVQLHSVSEQPLYYLKYITIVVSALSQIASSLVSAISTIALSFNYFNLRERKEVTGLISKIDQIELDDVNA